jgi:hypothetical protein
MPDLRHGPTLLNGCLSRFAASPPEPIRSKLRRLRKFVRWRVKQLFKPLQPGQVKTVSEWLESCPYPEWRKRELMNVWIENHGQLRRRHFKVDSHGKRETYLMYKNARGINSRSDMFKCATGPVFKAMEDEVYKHPAFIKHTPVRLRPALIKEVLGGFPGPFYETDYSQFEKHFTPEVMSSLEMILYGHMLKHYPSMFETIKSAMLGKNVCRFGTFTIEIRARRMSGEMCTSLGNGFSNLMLAEFIAHEKGGTLTGFVEGDDGLFFSSVPVEVSDFRELGFEIKIKRHLNLLRTSFCGLVASDDLITMTDPRKVLVTFGWTHSLLMMGGKKVRDGLLKAKALSLAYEHPQCPILATLATTVLDRLPRVDARFDTGWYEQHLNSEVVSFKEETERLLLAGPSDTARTDFAAHFGISVQQQLKVEEEISHWNGGMLDGPWTLALFDSSYEHCRDYCERFTSATRRSPCL